MRLKSDDRGRISFVDVIMTFGALVALVGVGPWIYDLISMLQGEADALTSTLLALFVPLLFISLLISVGVSAR